MMIKQLLFVFIFLIELLFIIDLARIDYDTFAILMLCKIIYIVALKI